MSHFAIFSIYLLQAFAEGASSAISLELNEELELQQHYSQVWRACFILLGIYAFFTIEQLMKAKAIWSGNKVRNSKIDF